MYICFIHRDTDRYVYVYKFTKGYDRYRLKQQMKPYYE